MKILIIFGIIYYSLYLFSFVYEALRKWSLTNRKRKTDLKLRNNHPMEKDLTAFSFWKTNIEAKYRNLTYYPPDWGIRKKYIAAIYNHNCAICHKDDQLGHTHHINSLKDGGTNAIQNLVYICRSCHEEQHWHLKQRKESRLEEIKKLGITEEEYFKEKKEQYKLSQEMDKILGYPNRRFNALISKGRRATKKGEQVDWIKISQEEKEREP